MKIICNLHDVQSRHYVPPVLGNGMMAFQLTPEGGMKQTYFCSMIPAIVRAGFRYASPSQPLADFGYFDFPLQEKMKEWTQTLDTENCFCQCHCYYESGLETITTVFCHAQKNIIGIRREIIGNSQKMRFSYQIPENEYIVTSVKNRLTLAYHLIGQNSGGKISLKVFAEGTHFADSHSLNWSNKTSHADFLLSFDCEPAPHDTWDSLFASHCAAHKEYFAENSISLLNTELMKMYSTAQYHLRIFSTPWSVPTGLFHSHWEGRFFAYDELFVHDALLSSKHFEAAWKIDDFRLKTLEKAISRACYAQTCSENLRSAHIPWETKEDGTEGSPAGYWLDQCHHVAHVAICAWRYYLHTRNVNRLKELYPLIHACAMYLFRGMIYNEASGPFVGRCTDMERFGEFIDHGYTSTCAIAACFYAVSESSECLGYHDCFSAKWKNMADNLLKNLTVEKNRYAMYPGCTQRSVAAYHGIYPYEVLSPKDPRQIATMADADAHFDDFAGQYFHGTTVSSWYTGVIANAYIRCGRLEKAEEMLVEAANHTGCFRECFEVYERQKLPWFTTAAGSIITAVNKLAIQKSTK